MSGAKLRRQAAVWREAGQVQGNVRQRFFASRGGYSLFVLVIRTDDEFCRVRSQLDDPRVEDGVDVSRANYHNIPRRSIEAQVAVAKQWAENEADRLAGLR